MNAGQLLLKNVKETAATLKGDSTVILLKTESEDHLVLLTLGNKLNKMTDLFTCPMSLLNKPG